MVRTPERDVHVHVHEVGDAEAQDKVRFRDRLRSSAEDSDISSTAKHFTGPACPVSTDRHVWVPPSLFHTQIVLSADPLKSRFRIAAKHKTASLCPRKTPP